MALASSSCNAILKNGKKCTRPSKFPDGKCGVHSIHNTKVIWENCRDKHIQDIMLAIHNEHQ